MDLQLSLQRDGSILGVRESQSGHHHIRAANCCDFVNTTISAFLGPFPAATRILLSIVFTIAYIPRLDVRLPGHYFDRTVHDYIGIIDEMRLRGEFQVKRSLEAIEYENKKNKNDIIFASAGAKYSQPFASI